MCCRRSGRVPATSATFDYPVELLLQRPDAGYGQAGEYRNAAFQHPVGIGEGQVDFHVDLVDAEAMFAYGPMKATVSAAC